MAGIELALDDVVRSGNCAAIARATRRERARSALAQPGQLAGAGKDYCLFDEQGKRLGTISSACMRPVLGKNAPTFYLRREPQLPLTRTRPTSA